MFLQLFGCSRVPNHYSHGGVQYHAALASCLERLAVLTCNFVGCLQCLNCLDTALRHQFIAPEKCCFAVRDHCINSCIHATASPGQGLETCAPRRQCLRPRGIAVGQACRTNGMAKCRWSTHNSPAIAHVVAVHVEKGTLTSCRHHPNSGHENQKLVKILCY